MTNMLRFLIFLFLGVYAYLTSNENSNFSSHLVMLMFMWWFEAASTLLVAGKVRLWKKYIEGYVPFSLSRCCYEK